MIKDWRHKGLRSFFETGSKAGIQPAHAKRLRAQLTALNSATSQNDMALPNWGLHPLQGDSQGRWAVTVNGNWRLVFAFEGRDAILVDYKDYH